MDLSAAEVELSPLDRREYRLADKLADIKDNFDYILIDCPPSLGLLTVNALCAQIPSLFLCNVNFMLLKD